VRLSRAEAAGIDTRGWLTTVIARLPTPWSRVAARGAGRRTSPPPGTAHSRSERDAELPTMPAWLPSCCAGAGRTGRLCCMTC
jgi:hypothetical protein